MKYKAGDILKLKGYASVVLVHNTGSVWQLQFLINNQGERFYDSDVGNGGHINSASNPNKGDDRWEYLGNIGNVLDKLQET